MAWLLLLRNVAGALAVMAGFGYLGSPAGFVWGAVAGGLAVAQRDDAYIRGMARLSERPTVDVPTSEEVA